MKLLELFEDADERPREWQRRPELKYDEKKVNDQLDRVIVTLESRRSAAATKLANRYRRLIRINALVSKEKENLNLKSTQLIESLFDASDEILTRVVKTVSIVFTLGKKHTQTTEKIDVDGFLERLLEVFPDMEEQLLEIKKDFTTVNTVEKKPALYTPKLINHPKPDDMPAESIGEAIGGIVGRLTNWARKRYNSVKTAMQGIDAKLEAITNDLAILIN